MTVRIVLADDHPIFRDGLVRSLEEAASRSWAPAAARTRRWRSSRATARTWRSSTSRCPAAATTAARRIAAQAPGTRIVMLTVSEADQDVLDALKAGAIGYVLKGVSATELAGILAAPPPARRTSRRRWRRGCCNDMQRPAEGPPRVDDLTKREEDILRRVARGLSNREVAEELDPGEDGQALHDLDPGEAARPQPGRGGADRPRRLGRRVVLAPFRAVRPRAACGTLLR